MDKYEINVICQNCGHKGRIKLAVGMRVTEARCPVCMCKGVLGPSSSPMAECIKEA